MMRLGPWFSGCFFVGVDSGDVDVKSLDGHDLLFVQLNRRRVVRSGDQAGHCDVVGFGVDLWRLGPERMRRETRSQREQAAHPQHANRQQTDCCPHVLRPACANSLESKGILGRNKAKKTGRGGRRRAKRRLNSPILCFAAGREDAVARRCLRLLIGITGGREHLEVAKGLAYGRRDISQLERCVFD